MKKTSITALVLILGLGSMATSLVAEEVVSERGGIPLDHELPAPEAKQYAKDGNVIQRDYVQQPPLVPHKVDGYVINRKSNKCLTCHSWANAKESGATKISQTHFEDRDKNVLANVSARRYFCTQCHVPQVNAQPLVENTFKPITAISGQ